MSFRRITVEDMERLAEKHGVSLAYGFYGFVKTDYEDRRLKGCAVSMLALLHTNDPATVRPLIDMRFARPDSIARRRFADAINSDCDYINGLESGFEGWSLMPEETENPSPRQVGIIDGIELARWNNAKRTQKADSGGGQGTLQTLWCKARAWLLRLQRGSA